MHGLSDGAMKLRKVRQVSNRVLKAAAAFLVQNGEFVGVGRASKAGDTNFCRPSLPDCFQPVQRNEYILLHCRPFHREADMVERISICGRLQARMSYDIQDLMATYRIPKDSSAFTNAY